MGSRFWHLRRSPNRLALARCLGGLVLWEIAARSLNSKLFLAARTQAITGLSPLWQAATKHGRMSEFGSAPRRCESSVEEESTRRVVD